MKKSKELPLPRHIGIIMDGNGRWARRKGLPRSAGHSAGAGTFREIARYCNKIGLEYLTVYAFSTENWKRPAEEVENIMNILRRYLKDAKNFKDENIRVRFIGDLSRLPEDLIRLIRESEEGSADATGMRLFIALNYGGRDEILQAARCLAGRAAAGELEPESITQEDFADCLYTAGIPDPDIIIRPSGELRLSNFLVWQAAYSEFAFLDVLWPDFRPKHLEQVLAEYRKRERRFGGV